MFQVYRDQPLVTWAFVVPLAVVFIFAGIVTLTMSPPMIERFAAWGYASWFLDLIGILEIISGILLLIPSSTFFGATALTGLILGLGYMHIANGSGVEVLPYLVFLMLLGVVIWHRRPGPRWM